MIIRTITAGPSLTLCFASLSADTVTLTKGDHGWQMQVDDTPFYVKGFTWSHMPVGMKCDYNLFAEEEPAIKAAIKRDMISYHSGGDWFGIMWQHPELDWHNNTLVGNGFPYHIHLDDIVFE